MTTCLWSNKRAKPLDPSSDGGNRQATRLSFGLYTGVSANAPPVYREDTQRRYKRRYSILIGVTFRDQTRLRLLQRPTQSNLPSKDTGQHAQDSSTGRVSPAQSPRLFLKESGQSRLGIIVSQTQKSRSQASRDSSSQGNFDGDKTDTQSPLVIKEEDADDWQSDLSPDGKSQKSQNCRNNVVRVGPEGEDCKNVDFFDQPTVEASPVQTPNLNGKLIKIIREVALHLKKWCIANCPMSFEDKPIKSMSTFLWGYWPRQSLRRCKIYLKKTFFLLRNLSSLNSASHRNCGGIYIASRILDEGKTLTKRQ